MAIASGERIAYYEVGERIGAGGMGEVFQATDTQLKRQVAIKVLPDSFATDADRLARFQQEAEILASLNHPNIAQIYGLEKHGDSFALIMELVEGPTLADRIAEGPIAPNEALAIGYQIIDALEAAHDKHIVHRDLKPANIKLKSDGTVKVLDFGIAKPVEAVGISGGPAASLMTPAMTETGIIMGTAAYMSPEQARGRFVDERTDIWAFGCVLFEMLTGQSAFEGEDIAVTLARIIERDTDFGSMSAAISPSVRHALSLCLKKDPRQRIADIRDVRLALAGEFESVDSETAVGSGHSWPKTVFTSVAAAVLAGLLVWLLAPSTAESPAAATEVVRFTVALDGIQANADDGDTLFLGGSDTGFGRPALNPLAVSNDGTTIVFSAWNNKADGSFSSQLYLKRLDQDTAEPIPGTEGGLSPFFSPDDQWLGYSQGGTIRRMSLATRRAETILSNPEVMAIGLWGAHWLEDQSIVFAAVTGLYRIPDSGGTLEQLVESDANADDYGYPLAPNVLPGNDVVLFHSMHSSLDPVESAILAVDLTTGTRTTVLTDATNPRYVPAIGQLLFVRRGELMAVAFDAATLALEGEPVGVLQDVAQAVGMPNTGSESGIAAFSLGRSGHLAYAPGGVYPVQRRQIVKVSASGTAEALVTDPLQYLSNRVSPDAGRIVFQDMRGRASNIYVHDLNRGVTQRIDTGGFSNTWPTWSPDGRSIAFSSDRDGVQNIYRVAADGGGEPERLVPSERGQSMASWSVDGVIAYLEGGDIWLLPPDGEAAVFFTSDVSESHPTFSPDGRWIAYGAPGQSGPEVYVRPYPGPGAASLVAGPASAPLWSPDGRRIYFYDRSAAPGLGVSSVDFAPGAPPVIGRAEAFIESWPFPTTLPIRESDILADGSIVSAGTEAQLDAFIAGTAAPSARERNRVTEFRVVTHFVDTLRQRAGAQ